MTRWVTVTMIRADITASSLPEDVSSHSDAAEIERTIFRVPCLRNVRALLRAPDTLSFFGLQCGETRDLKGQAGFVGDDSQCVVKAGMRFKIEQLIDLVEKHSVSTSGIR